METTMHQELDNNTKDAPKSNNNTKGVNITDLIKYTPNLGEYIKASILTCLLYTSPSPRDVEESRMPSSA